jgi:sialate O-acetylesterase
MKCYLAIIFISLFLSARAQLRLPALIRDSMVLQREVPLKIWGWALPGEKIELKFSDRNYKTKTGTDGKWRITLPAMKPGGPHTMEVRGSNKITIKDILIGDVYLCSGQSNMVHQMILHRERYEDEIANANYPDIRQFWVPNVTNLQNRQEDVPVSYWKSANPKDVLQFSAVAYFFAKAIHEKHKIPIGLINASWGGTPIEAWTSEDGLKGFSTVINTIQKNKDTAYVNSINRAAAAYNASRPKPQDKGLLESTPWFDATYVPNNWRNITVPGYWEDQGIRNLDGIVWYRKEIDIPSLMTSKSAKLALGRIVDADVVYINGKHVGNTTYQYPQRRYQIPEGTLKPGKNIIVVRVINYSGKGGFVPDKPYYLATEKDTIDLKGEWQYKVGDAFAPQKSPVNAIAFHNQPAALFNAMIAPIVNYQLKGILWYQGESNVNNANQYGKLLPALINDWRKQWQQNDLPFLYVQLPNYDDVQYLPSESPWAVLREGQLKTLSLTETGMAVAIDLGEWNDIHPDRKKEVGDRLALLARKMIYGEKIVASGPLFESAKIEGNKIIISFSNTGSGLIVHNGEELSEFAIAGEDKKFVWANANIEGNKVVVWSEALDKPMYVRYAWADNPGNPNLYNKEGLPASPFRTDQ